jgi:hypothetical protein
MQSLFGFYASQASEPLTLRRRALYPDEVRELVI